MDNPSEIKCDRPREIVEIPIEQLKPSPDNPRTHSARQLRMLGRSIKKFGFVGAVLIDEDNQIIAGHGRALAAKKLGYTTVPTLKVSHLSKAEARAYLVADNRLAEKSGWDRKLLWNSGISAKPVGDFRRICPLVVIFWNPETAQKL